MGKQKVADWLRFLNLYRLKLQARGGGCTPPPHHHGGGGVVLGGQNQNLREVALYISALTGCSVHDLRNVLWYVLRITYIYL